MKKKWNKFVKKTKKWFKELIDIILAPSMAFLPGNVAYFLILSIFPVLTLIGSIASNFSLNINSVINFMDRFLPSNIVEVISSFIQGKGLDSNLGIFMIIGFILASNGTHAMILASNNLYKFKNDTWIKRRIKAFFLIVLLLLLFIFMLAFIGFNNKIFALLYNIGVDTTFVDTIRTIYTWLKWPFTLFVIYFNVKLIYTISPDHKILSKTTTKGAIFTTISWAIVIRLYSAWIERYNAYNIFYGSLSNIVIFMIIIYLISFVLVIGIAINAKQYEYNKEKEKE